MTQVLDAVGESIHYFTRKVTAKSDMEQDDAQQELLITAWQASELYPFWDGAEECTFAQFAMTKMHFKTLSLVHEGRTKQVQNEKRMNLLKSEPMSYSPTENLCCEIAFQQELDKLPRMVSDVLRHRKLGYDKRAISRITGASYGTVIKILKKY